MCLAVRRRLRLNASLGHLFTFLLLLLRLRLLILLQLEEVDEFVCVLAGREVDKVSWDPVAQARAGLHCHLTGGGAEGRALLLLGLLHFLLIGREHVPRFKLLPREEQGVGHLAEGVDVDEPHPPTAISVHVQHKVFVGEVVLDVLREEGLDGLADVIHLLGDVVVVLSVVSLADPDEFVFLDEATELSARNEFAPLPQDELVVDDWIWGIFVIAMQEWLSEVVGDEVGALEEQKYVTQTLTLQGAVQRNPVSVLRSAPVQLGENPPAQSVDGL